MTQCTADFETGVSGQNILAADAGSATKWDLDDNTTDITYDTAHVAAGTLAGKFIFGASDRHLNWTTAFGTPSEHYGRLYMYQTAYPTANTRGLFGNGSAWNVDFEVWESSGGLLVVNYNSTALGMTVPSALNQLVRIEWHVIHSTTVGMFDLRLYNTASAAVGSYDDRITLSSVNTGTAPTDQHFGTWNGASGSHTVWLDDIVAGASGFVGPIGVRTPGWADVTVTA